MVIIVLSVVVHLTVNKIIVCYIIFTSIGEVSLPVTFNALNSIIIPGSEMF